jgi:hypothetical protein
MFGSSVVVMPICLNKDKTVGTQSVAQDGICYLCGESAAIILTRNDEVYACCGHTSLCPNCVDTWHAQCKLMGTCPTCRNPWDPTVIANNMQDWQAQKRPHDGPAELAQKFLKEGPAELPVEATAELPAEATAELPADEECYDAEQAQEHENMYRMKMINTQSGNMASSACPTCQNPCSCQCQSSCSCRRL